MPDDIDFMFKPIVLVTGFGPFLNHPVNASWEAVKLMNKEEIEKKHNVELVLLEIPVTYENVDEFVPALWETHTPKVRKVILYFYSQTLRYAMLRLKHALLHIIML